jgi:hypothetical protein
MVVLDVTRPEGAEAWTHLVTSQISSVEKKGLFCQMSMALAIYRAHEHWQGPLAFAMGFVTAIKCVHMGYSYLGDSIFTHVKQKLEAAGPVLTKAQRQKVEEHILGFYRAQRLEVDRLEQKAKKAGGNNSGKK